MINECSILNGAKYFSIGIFQSYLVLYQGKNTLNILVALLRLNCGNLMECQESIEIITKSHSNFAPTFVDHLLLPDMNFNGHCLIKINISISKK